MNIMRVFNRTFLAGSGMALILSSCSLFGGGSGASDRGELIGVQGREGWEMTRPFGMVSIPAGTFHMGQADEDVAATQINFNKQVTIGAFFMDDTEITNNEYRQFTEELTGAEADIPPGYSVGDLMPDTSVWVKDFTHHMGDPLVVYYWSHPAFDNYPVVGVDWNAAKYFAEWRTRHLNDYRRDVAGLPIMPNFRLPSEAEWEYAARGGRDMNKYPWGNPYIRNVKGCLLANFKPGRGNYYDDGFAYTAPVATFFANDYGLYDMSGNVAEWCEDAYNPSSVPLVWDLNPTYFDERIDYKVVRGGSWKDVAYYLETGTRSYEHRDTARSSVGFRCAMTYLGRSSGYEF